MLDIDYLRKIKDWFETYPLIDKNGKIYANLISQESVSYGIVENPSAQNGVIRTFVGGDRVIQYVFDFDTRYTHGTTNTAKNSNWNNSKSYQELSDWVYEQNRLDILPEIEGIQSIEVVTSPFVKQVAPNGDTAIHSMTMRITVYKEFKK